MDTIIWALHLRIHSSSILRFSRITSLSPDLSDIQKSIKWTNSCTSQSTNIASCSKICFTVSVWLSSEWVKFGVNTVVKDFHFSPEPSTVMLVTLQSWTSFPAALMVSSNPKVITSSWERRVFATRAGYYVLRLATLLAQRFHVESLCARRHTSLKT